MKKFKKISLIVMSIMLCFTVLCQTATAAFLSPGNVSERYIRDIKLIYADSVDEAKTQLPADYRLLENNLNEGTGELGVYVCYSTTKDPEEAITDIKVMHESGGFQRTDFKASLNDAIDGVYSLAQEMTTAVNEFIQNYNNGVPAAVYAKEALNYFQYDANTLLGDFMLSGTGTYQDYGRMILMCHEDILNPILSLLALGVQQKAGENWIDRLANVDPTTYSSAQDAKYRDRATKLRPILQQFNDIYCYVMGYYDTTYTYDDLTDENDKELFLRMAENKDIFTMLRTILRSYTVGIRNTDEYGAWTAEDMFTIGLNNTMNLYESYALLECLTPGQEIMLRLTGPYNFIIGSQNTDEVLAEARKAIVENLDTNEKIPIWDGVNLDIFEQEVGLTNEAQRSIAAGKQYDIFAKDVDTLAQKYRDIASVVSSSFTIASGAILVTKCAMVIAPKFFSFISCYSIAGAISSFASAAIVSTIMAITGAIFTVASIVCSIFITFFLEDIITWMLTEEYDRTSIPKYMVDEAINKEGISTYAYYQRVDNVRTDEQLGLDTEDNESGSDINVNEGYRWMALYTSNKSSLGNPIKEGFLVATDSGVEKEGYVPLAMFGKTVAENLNGYADKVSSKYPALYLHYPQDKITPVESEKIYISHIRVESAKHEDEAKKRLTDSGFLVFNHNFGCKDSESTFIGYKLTANANDAVKDIRLLYNCNSSSVTFGDLNYGAMGTIGNFSLMVSSTSSNPAPPVLHLAVYEKNVLPDAALGYEPVNEFSGGMAHALGRTDYRLYFMPETTFTTGPDYLAGIKSDVYYYNTFTSQTGHNHPFVYYDETDMFENSVDSYRAYKAQTYREQFFDFNSQTYFYFAARNSKDSNNYVNLAYKYTTTKNPYRAIYGVTANKSNGLDRFADSVKYAQIGYVLAAAELSYNSSFYTGYKFPYKGDNNKNEFGNYYSFYRAHENSTNNYYSSKNSYGKADAWYKDLPGTVSQRTAVHSEEDVFNQDITQVLYNSKMSALYLSGYQANRTPLTVNDIILSKTPLDISEIPSNFTPVICMIGNSAEPANIVPSHGDAVIGVRPTLGGLSSEDVKAVLYDKVYMYFRNEKTEKGKAVAQSNPKEGKYVSAIYIESREEIRESNIKNSKTDEEILCENIGKAVVENSLFGKGATTTYRININTEFDEDDDIESANYTYVGIQKSDKASEALTDIRLYVAKKGERPEPEINRTITYNGETFPVKYTRVSLASLTEQGDKSDADCAMERQVYVYVSSHPALGEPITEVKMSDMFSYDDFEPVLTMDNKYFITAYNENEKAGGAEIFVEDDYFMHGNQLSFKREGADKPYIQSINLAYGSDDIEAATKLLEAGYTDIVKKDLNEDAGGKYIYLGMKRTADKNDAVYDLKLTNNQKNPAKTFDKYTLVSNLDLNYKAGGKYIYLYECRKPASYKYSPLLDIKAVDETVLSITTGTAAGAHSEIRVTNQDGNSQDLNEEAGGDYIYLIKVYEYNDNGWLVGSMLGTGSIAVIVAFLVAAAGAVIYVKLKKKRESENIV